jgi:hypothetical protein
VGDGVGLEAVEFIERTINGRIGDEVVQVIGFGSLTLSFVNERRRTREGVVDCADYFGVGEGFAS